jgi:hypothetical protein
METKAAISTATTELIFYMLLTSVADKLHNALRCSITGIVLRDLQVRLMKSELQSMNWNACGEAYCIEIWRDTELQYSLLAAQGGQDSSASPISRVYSHETL